MHQQEPPLIYRLTSWSGINYVLNEQKIYVDMVSVQYHVR